MIAYSEVKDKKTCLCSNVEILCTKEELDVLINKLLDFQNKINIFHEKKIPMGLVHVHYQDNNKLWNKSDTDIIFYVKG